MANVPPKSNVRTGFFGITTSHPQIDVESDRVTALKIAKAGKQPTSSVAFFAKARVITQDISNLAKALDLATNRETVKIEADLLKAPLHSNPEESSPNVFRLR